MGIFLDENEGKKKKRNSMWDEKSVAIVVTEWVDKNLNFKYSVI